MFGGLEDLDCHNPPFGFEVEDDPGPHLFTVHDGSVCEPDLEGV